VTPEARKLENGDTLLVPPVSAQVTVTGMVRRPSIYELHDEKTLASVLELAGGILPAATLKHVEVQRLVAHEKRTMLSLDLSDDDSGQLGLTSFTVRDGDEIHIFPIAPYNQEAIYLQGHVLRPGKYSFRPGMKLTEIITSYHDLLPEPAAHYGEIIRLNPPDFRPSVVSLDWESARKNQKARPHWSPWTRCVCSVVLILSRHQRSRLAGKYVCQVLIRLRGKLPCATRCSWLAA